VGYSPSADLAVIISDNDEVGSTLDVSGPIKASGKATGSTDRGQRTLWDDEGISPRDDTIKIDSTIDWPMGRIILIPPPPIWFTLCDTARGIGVKDPLNWDAGTTGAKTTTVTDLQVVRQAISYLFDYGNGDEDKIKTYDCYK